DEDNAFWGKVLNSPSTESPAPPRPSTPSRLAFFIRQQSSGGGSGGGGPSTPTSIEPLQSGPNSSHPLSPDSPMHQLQTHTECLDWDSGYLEYLKDARRGIELCSWACRDWSAPYDGENPSPITAPPPPPPPTSNPSMVMLPEHFSFHQGGSTNTPPVQQRAAIVAAARSEWSSSERDSGEWDITIGKNSCISLTPRSKKRSLQREELLPKPVPPLVPSSSSSATSLTTSHAASSPAPHIPTSAITVSYQAMYNGTMGLGDGCSDSRDRGLEKHSTRGPQLLKTQWVQGISIEAFTTGTERAGGQGEGTTAEQPVYRRNAQRVLTAERPEEDTQRPWPWRRKLITLLRSFLLNTNMVSSTSVQVTDQVLGSVKNRIEAFAASHEDFPAMLKKAQQYLVARGKVDWTDSPAAVPPLRRSDSLVKSRKPSLGDLILRHTNSPTRARNAAQLALAHVRDGSQSLTSALFRGSGGSSGLEKQAEALRVKNAVYCAVIFCEFLKELAALAQEHAVTLPFPQSQEVEE
ncbi:unnamed protein product, partial [Pleuronectes platessa]